MVSFLNLQSDFLGCLILIYLIEKRYEDEWLHLKRDELACRVFEDEFDLAMAIIASVELRAKRRGYQVERFIFN